MGLILRLFIIAVILTVDFFVACEFSSIAEEKGYESKPYFWYTFFLGIVGMLMVVALPDRGQREK